MISLYPELRTALGYGPLLVWIPHFFQSFVNLDFVDNYPEPGKRPLSSTAPTIIENEDGSLYLVLGGSGGSRIFGSLFQTILNLEYGLNIGEAVEYGRVHHQLYPNLVDVDNVFLQEHIEDLRLRGHNVLGRLILWMFIQCMFNRSQFLT
jgi:gamma-glutamyltranspeptidase